MCGMVLGFDCRYSEGRCRYVRSVFGGEQNQRKVGICDTSCFGIFHVGTLQGRPLYGGKGLFGHVRNGVLRSRSPFGEGVLYVSLCGVYVCVVCDVGSLISIQYKGLVLRSIEYMCVLGGAFANGCVLACVEAGCGAWVGQSSVRARRCPLVSHLKLLKCLHRCSMVASLGIWSASCRFRYGGKIGGVCTG